MATAARVRTALSRHPTATDCATVAASVTGHPTDVVVFDNGRSFLVASSAPIRLLVPRSMTAAEAAVVGGSAEFECPDGAALPIELDGRPVAALSVRGRTSPNQLDVVAPLADMIARELRQALHATDHRPDELAQRVLAGLRDAVVIVSHDFDILWANPGAISLLGFTPDRLVGRSAAEFVDEADLARALDALSRMAQGLEVDRLRLRLRTADGGMTAVEVMATDMGSDPVVNGLVLSLRDANLESELSAEVARNRHVSGAVLHGLTDGILAVDAFGTVTVANTVARELLGIEPERALSDITIPAEALFTSGGRAVDVRAETSAPVRCLLPSDGDIRYVDVVRRSVRDDDGGDLGTVVVLTDVTEAHLADEHLREQALHDQLTGLANRRQLDRVLAELEASSNPNPVAAAFIDLDGFKLVNDNHGHRVGDEVIRIAARRLSAVMRRGDLLVRQGGDEFVALITGCPTLAVASASADRLRAELAKPYVVAGERFDLSASIGVAVRSSAATSTDLLLRQADIALYEAKRRGRNRVAAFDESLAESVQGEEDHRRLLRAALDDDRIVMHFQPLVDADTEQIRGYEALARVVAENGELLTPDRFLESIANSGLVWELDQVAFRLSCDAARLLRTVAHGSPPHVACNFSPVSLSHPDFVDFVVSTTDQAGVDRSSIRIEMTESAAFDSGNRSAQALVDLERAGFHLSLDDFGTGYSSLAHLRDLPIASVKVDRSFVARLTEGGSERAIADAVVTLARDLDLDVVAEGVENAEQLTHARALGFGLLQGWYFAPALPLERCLEHWRNDEVRRLT